MRFVPLLGAGETRRSTSMYADLSVWLALLTEDESQIDRAAHAW